MARKFPGRQIVPPFRVPKPRPPETRRLASRTLTAGIDIDVAATSPPPPMFKFRKGIEEKPEPMSDDEVRALGDVFSRRLILEGKSPLTLRALLEAIGSLSDPVF